MDYGFLGNFERFELMAFFSGYALIYLLLNGLWRNDFSLKFSKARLLSYSYALTGTLFIGYVVRKIFINLDAGNQVHFYHPILYLFGILAALFWIPVFSKRSSLALLHSLVFFALIPLDIISYARGSVEREQVGNDMNVLSISIIFNVSTAILMFIFLRLSQKKRNRPEND
jgi:hypothetical protein